MLAGLRISVADAVQRDWADTGFAASNVDCLIAGQTLIFGNRMTLSDAVSGVAFLPDDKENSFVAQGIRPGKVDIGTIHDNDTALR